MNTCLVQSFVSEFQVRIETEVVSSSDLLEKVTLVADVWFCFGTYLLPPYIVPARMSVMPNTMVRFNVVVVVS